MLCHCHRMILDFHLDHSGQALVCRSPGNAGGFPTTPAECRIPNPESRRVSDANPFSYYHLPPLLLYRNAWNLPIGGGLPDLRKQW
jgi:hypothetical protein